MKRVGESRFGVSSSLLKKRGMEGRREKGRGKGEERGRGSYHCKGEGGASWLALARERE